MSSLARIPGFSTYKHIEAQNRSVVATQERIGPERIAAIVGPERFAILHQNREHYAGFMDTLAAFDVEASDEKAILKHFNDSFADLQADAHADLILHRDLRERAAEKRPTPEKKKRKESTRRALEALPDYKNLKASDRRVFRDALAEAQINAGDKEAAAAFLSLWIKDARKYDQ